MDPTDMSKDPKLIELLAQVTDISPDELLSEDSNGKLPSVKVGDEILELGNNLDLNKFQVVRKEFFAHLFEPAATFSNCKFYVNTSISA